MQNIYAEKFAAICLLEQATGFRCGRSTLEETLNNENVLSHPYVTNTPAGKLEDPQELKSETVLL